MRTFISFDSPVPPIVLPLAAAFLVIAALNGPARAQSRTFVIAGQDGYGVTECVSARKDCGRIIADAWCEGHGYGKASAWGSADDITASIPAASSRPPKGSVIISCGE